MNGTAGFTNGKAGFFSPDSKLIDKLKINRSPITMGRKPQPEPSNDPFIDFHIEDSLSMSKALPDRTMGTNVLESARTSAVGVPRGTSDTLVNKKLGINDQNPNMVTDDTIDMSNAMFISLNLPTRTVEGHILQS